MASEGTNLFSSLDIPNLSGAIVGAGDEDIVVELQAHDAVGVATENSRAEAAVFPVRADLEAGFVDVFPWSLPWNDGLGRLVFGLWG
jgi:hypothetical protein